MRPVLLPGCFLLLSACAGPDIVDGRSNALPACGPEVSVNSVRSLKLVDEYAALGREATLRLAEEKLGPIELLDGAEAIAYWYPQIEGTAARMGCDVVLHVRRTVVKSRFSNARERYHVILARRETDDGDG